MSGWIGRLPRGDRTGDDNDVAMDGEEFRAEGWSRIPRAELFHGYVEQFQQRPLHGTPGLAPLNTLAERDGLKFDRLLQ